MRTRLLFAVLGFFILLAPGAACRSSSPLTKVSLSSDTISPNGDGFGDFTTIEYTLSRDARVSIRFIDSDGKEYSFRKDEPRAAGTYTAKFYGTYAPDEAKPYRHAMSDGTYTYIVTAENKGEKVNERQGQIFIKGADTNYLEVREVAIFPSTISPNGDAIDDEAHIGYAVSKQSVVSIFVTDAASKKYILEAPNEKAVGLHYHLWDGTANGQLLPDGLYILHISAEDRSGNVTEEERRVTIEGGGTPRLELLSVRFDPPALPLGSVLNVEIKVKNTGNVPLRSLGPPPGTAYDTTQNFMQFKGEDGQPLYYERAGFWRVGIGWDQADRPYPVRWGLLKENDKALQPGEEATITGTIKVLIDRTREVRFWATWVQEGVGFGGRMGQKTIVISY